MDITLLCESITPLARPVVPPVSHPRERRPYLVPVLAGVLAAAVVTVGLRRRR